MLENSIGLFFSSVTIPLMLAACTFNTVNKMLQKVIRLLIVVELWYLIGSDKAGIITAYSKKRNRLSLKL